MSRAHGAGARVVVCCRLLSRLGVHTPPRASVSRSNITNTQNIVYHTKCAGYHQHYGLNNLMLNNVVADVNQGNCDGAVRSSQHPGKCKLPAKGEAQGRCSSFSFVRNIVYVGVVVASDAPVAHTTNTYGAPVSPLLTPYTRTGTSLAALCSTRRSPPGSRYLQSPA